MPPKKQEQNDLDVINDLKRQLNNFTLLAAFILFLIAFSTWFYHITERWNWIDSVYFVIVTLGTVGYGDFSPTTDAGKIYAIGLIIVGIASFGFFAQQLIKRQQLRALERQQKKLSKK